MLDAESHVFGVGLFNDWSARDIQAWEYQPLGPFLSKNFASTLSPWVVTLDALAPFRAPFIRPAGDPEPMDYLDSPTNRAQGAISIELEVWLQTPKMRQAGHAGDCISQSNYADAYWTVAQLVAHHTVNGCNLRAGDLFGSGTLSGPKPEQGGSLMELSTGGKQPFALSNGETRAWLEDGDSIILRGYCAQEGFRRIGFGECRGTVLPSFVKI
jgi:fumarylacetoacetase